MGSDRKYIKKMIEELKHNRKVMGNMAEKILNLGNNYGSIKNITIIALCIMVLSVLACIIL